MSQTVSTKPPSGMRDFLAPAVVRRRHVLGVVQRVYESFGFVPLETPAIENLTTLLGKYGPEGDQLLYRILHRRERLQRSHPLSLPRRRHRDAAHPLLQRGAVVHADERRQIPLVRPLRDLGPAV